ncbi:hypothetical protein F66182_2723 [Fusarium sp. NRRL 66182]|nr:hypothetical protein F66182_2723 [Fusarium sp. NRRL 66182]
MLSLQAKTLALALVTILLSPGVQALVIPLDSIENATRFYNPASDYPLNPTLPHDKFWKQQIDILNQTGSESESNKGDEKELKDEFKDELASQAQRRSYMRELGRKIDETFIQKEKLQEEPKRRIERMRKSKLDSEERTKAWKKFKEDMLKEQQNNTTKREGTTGLTKRGLDGLEVSYPAPDDGLGANPHAYRRYDREEQFFSRPTLHHKDMTGVETDRDTSD